MGSKLARATFTAKCAATVGEAAVSVWTYKAGVDRQFDHLTTELFF